MYSLDLFLQGIIHHPVLLDHRQAFERLTLYFDRVE